MDFFAAQDRAKARTRSLIVYFILGVAGLVVVLYVLALAGYNFHEQHLGITRFAGWGARYNSRNGLQISDYAGFSWWQPEVFFPVTLGTLAIVGGACLYKIAELRQGGSAVALSVGAQPMSPHPANLAEKRLRDIVEEMALASGVPVPGIYIIEEDSINAFAAGFRPEDAVVTVTRGALNYLTRDELQGVIAHEFSHILNGDMRLNVELVGAVFGLLVIAIIGRVILQSMGRTRVRGRDGGGAVVAMLAAGAALVVVGSLGVLFGRLIQASVSRQRERLADASGVQFTRNPQGLAGALKKIGGLAQGSLIEHAHVQETAHMFFAPALNGIFATHPPLEERIRELDPNWDGKFTAVKLTADDMAEIRANFPEPPKPITPAQMFLPATVAALFSLDEIRAWRDSLPASIKDALSTPTGCRALVLALALDANAAQRANQLQKLRDFGEAATETAATLSLELDQIPAGRKLPLLELALGGLAQTLDMDKNSLLARLRELTNFDRGQDLPQFALWRVAEYRLRPLPPRLGPPAPEFYRGDVSVVLSALAHLSTPDDAAAQPVFAQGLPALLLYGSSLPLTPRSAATLAEVQVACTRLEGAPFVLKKQLLEAGALIAQADGVVEPSEAELLRGLAASLGCAVPLN